MDDKKESVAEIYAKISADKKLENFIGMTPMVVSVQDDVAKKRFHITEYRGNRLKETVAFCS